MGLGLGLGRGLGLGSGYGFMGWCQATLEKTLTSRPRGVVSKKALGDIGEI